MKLKSIKTPLLAISLICGSTFAQAATIYLDFGDSPTSSYWNTANSITTWYNVINSSFAGPSTGSAVGNHLTLQNSNNTASGLTLTVTDLFATVQAYNAGGGVQFASTPVAAFNNLTNLSGDSLTVNNSNPTAGFTLSGLSSGYTYKFTIFASRADATDVRSGNYTLTGASSQTLTLNASSNSSNVVSTSFLSPKANGTIDFSMIMDAATNTNGSGFAYINGMEIEVLAVPEPATWAMLFGGAGMLVFGQRIRRRNRLN